MKRPDVVKWLREQSRLYASMADAVERDEQAPSLALLHAASGQITPAMIREVVGKNRMRVGDVAKRFDVSKDKVLRIVGDPGNGFSIGNRGWITLKDEVRV